MEMRYRRMILLIPLIPLALAQLSWASDGSDRASQTDNSLASSAPGSSAAQGPQQQTLRDREQAVLHQLSDTTDGDARYALLDGLASDYFRAGMVADSMRIREQIVEDSRIPAGRRSLIASSLAGGYAQGFDYARSERLLGRARALARDTTPAELETLPREPSYAYFSAEAEIDRRYLNRHDLGLLKRRESAELAWRNINDPALSVRRRKAAVNELLDNSSELIRLMVQNNRRTEALSYANEIRWDIENRSDMKPSPIQRAEIELGRSIALASNDDYDGAIAAVNAAITAFRKQNVAPYSWNLAGALRLRLMFALAIKHIGDYQADADAWEYAASVNPVVAHTVTDDERESLILAAHGNWQEAERRITAAMTKNLLRQGPESPFYKYQAAMLMLYRLEDPASNVGEADIAAYVKPLVGTQDDWNDSSTRGAYDEDGALAQSLNRAMSEGEQGQVLAFQIAELFHMNATQGAMADGAARLAASTPALRALIEQEQLLRHEQNTAHLALARSTNRLEAEQTQGGSQGRQNVASANVEHEENAIKAVDGKLASLRQQIAAQFPLYRQLVSPEIPTPDAFGKSLHEGEVYVDFYAGRDASYAFVVRPGGAFRAVRLSVTRTELARQVKALRAGFDAGVPPQHAGDLAGFDLGAAASLYQALIAPLHDDIHAATTVYIATSGVLASIPFDVLTTRTASSLADASWWIDTATPVRVPSASALALTRGHPAAHANEPLIAFADPSFDGHDSEAVGTPAGSVVARAFPVDTDAPAFDYHRVMPLPETMAEAHSIATALGASDQSVLRGTRASRSEAMKADLSNDRVVLFATHGIVAGEVPGWRKAGLAMAYEGSGLTDSILTADDIVTLRLNADWVVLSACNTGFVTGTAGDAISELSRAFFAAGARSMLVTQWAVESRSATEITTGVFRTYAGDPSLSKADALARAERDMAAGKDGALYRHPYFWGAYVLSGDAAR
ncbi:CHAT domain-containing protein [Paraburkholderia fungorum]|uniref:CHAT domain-containing protein n=1 Tax=Paraburkholderia fungorum TaxID=134537 RepID=UPI001C1E988A|nr:CHAT domain-containing protein [Paraburkholderia fungorum]MBU7439683.1 CHAT domain-containing protein [Paraburkholderia fungorum]